MNSVAPVCSRWRRALVARPALAIALDPLHFVLASFAAGVALLLHAFVFVAAFVVLDVVGINAYLASPPRRRAVMRQTRRRNRDVAARELRCNDGLQWKELEQTVVATEPALSPFGRDELDRLLELFIEVGVRAARWEGHVERLTKALPPTGDAPLASTRADRRARAARALAAFTSQLSTIASLIQLACEDAVALNAWTAAGSTTARVEEASRTAQLAMAATDDAYSPWELPAAAKREEAPGRNDY